MRHFPAGDVLGSATEESELLGYKVTNEEGQGHILRQANEEKAQAALTQLGAVPLPTAWHKRIQGHLLSIGRRLPKHFRKVYNDKRPVHITHPVKNRGFVYYPDVRFETKTGKLYLFEVMDTEVGSQAQVIAHIVEACLTPQVLKVFYIVRSEEDSLAVSHLTDVIVSNLSDARGDSLFKRVRFYYMIVTPQESKSRARVAQVLAETGQIPGQWAPGRRRPRRRLRSQRLKVRRRAR